MNDREIEIFITKVLEAKKELADLHQHKQCFKIFRDLASHCVDDQGRVDWELLERALNEKISMMTSR